VPAYVFDAHDPRLADEEPEQASPAWQGTDGSMLLGGDTCGDEIHQLAVVADHTESDVARVGDLGGEIDDSLQHHWQRELRGEGQASLE